MDLVINDKEIESYKIKYGAEVYKVNYPSWKEARVINDELKEVKEKENEELVILFIENKLIELGLNSKFFELPGVKASHIFKIWSEINSIKK